MEFKNFAKGLGTYFFAEVLCLFLAVTLSAVGGGLFRLISCICTIAVLVCVCVNYALNRAKEDQHRKLPNTIGRQLFYSVAAAQNTPTATNRRRCSGCGKLSTILPPPGMNALSSS